MPSFRLPDLNPEQQRAVRTTDGPVLILAGAGTGKTRVITTRIAFLIANGVPPDNILAVTFTNKAANEMRQRVATLVDAEAARRVTLSTFHALCVRLLRAHADRLGYKSNFSIYDEADQLGLLRTIIARLAAPNEKLDPALARNVISKAKNHGWHAPEDERSLVGAVFAHYQRDLKLLNAVDFDDLLLLGVKLLAEHPDVRARWHARFRYIMVDEFQDTNRLQLELVSLLAKAPPGTSGAGGHAPNLCVVGDDDQSIYGWRGAEVSNILEFEAHFPQPTVIRLEQNYRSTTAILDAANAVIRHNPRRRPKRLWSDRGAGERLRLIRMPDDRREAEFVANEIVRLRMMSSAPWEDFAVLFRMNAQSRLLEENLRRLGVPYRVVGTRSFFDRREVKDVLAYARCVLNPDDDASLLRILNTPARGISTATCQRALEASVAARCTVFRTLHDPTFTATLSPKAAAGLATFLEMLDRFETRLLEPKADAAQLLGQLLEETGYLAEVRRRARTSEEALERETAVRDLLHDIAQFRQRTGHGLREFLDTISLERDREEDDIEKKRGVTLLTLHAAKGLEFPTVFLIGVEEGILPHDHSKLEGTLDEECRLLYVGITRAMRHLTISYCDTRWKYGSPVPCHPSTFLRDLPEEVVERTDLAAVLRKPVTPEVARSRFAAIRASLSAADS